MAITRGARRFDAWAEEIGGNVAAELLSVGESTVSRLRSGKRVPSLALAVRIQRATRGWTGGEIVAAEWVPVRAPRSAEPSQPAEVAAA